MSSRLEVPGREGLVIVEATDAEVSRLVAHGYNLPREE